MKGRSRSAHTVAIAAVLGAVLLAYANSLQGDLVVDSTAIIGENPAIRAARAENVLYLLTHDYWQPMSTGGLYRPLTTLSYLFNYAVLGNAARPLGYHVVNLLLHMGCVLLLYGLVWQFSRREWCAGLAAALFGLHPITTEAVTNVVGRADLFAALGVLGGLLIHIRGGSRPRPRHLLGVAVAGLIAVFGKENGLLLPVVLLVHDGLARRRGWKSQAALVPVLVFYGMNRWWMQSQGLPPHDILAIDNPLVEVGFAERLLTIPKIVVLQLGLLLCPLWLSADYSYDSVGVLRWPVDSWGDLFALGSIPVLGAVVWQAVRRRERYELRFFSVFGLVALLPTANLFVVVGTIMAERVLYLPLAAFCAAIALAAEGRVRTVGTRKRSQTPAFPPRMPVALAALVCVAFGIRTHLRNRDWRDELSLWSSTLRAVPDSAKAHHGFAAALFARDPKHEKIDQVIAGSERAVAIRGDYLLALLDLGNRYTLKGDLLAASGERAEGTATESRDWYEKAVSVLERARVLEAADVERFRAKMRARGVREDDIPVYGNVEVHRGLAQALVRLGRVDDAQSSYRRAIMLDPVNPQLYIDVSVAFARAERAEDAAISLLEALVLDPGNQDAANRLAATYRMLGIRGAVVQEATGGAHIDLRQPTVREHRCLALQRLYETLGEARNPQDAARVKSIAQRDGCR